MMKHLIKYFSYATLFFCNNLQAQDNTNFVGNSTEIFSGINSNINNSYGYTSYFYNLKRKIEGSEYLFDTWKNDAVVFTKNNYKYSLKNINLNIKSNSFVSKIGKDSIFTFNMNGIDKMVIRNKVYKSVFSENGKKICQIIYETDNFSILKGFHLQQVEGSPNPMVNKKNDKIIRRKNYYILRDNRFKRFRLSKRKILNLVDVSKVSEIKKYVKRNKLSYRKEKAVKQLLEYVSSL